MDFEPTPRKDEPADKAEAPTKHTVKRGVAYVTLPGGALTRNYVVLGGQRVYVTADEGKELTKSQARRQTNS